MSADLVVHLRGTKREIRERDVPCVLPFQRSLLALTLEHAEGRDGSLFKRWGNVRRDLLDACRRAEIAPCSPNDLRRTFSNWMVEAAVPLNIVAQLMGHKDTRMLERVYGRQRTEQLATAVARSLPALGPAASGSSPGCSTGVTAGLDLGGFSGLPGLPPAASWSAAASLARPENTEAQRTLQSTGPLDAGRVGVPGGGIEPPTRGFSVPCSTI